MSRAAGPDVPLLRLRGASVAYADRTLWSDLDLDVRAGEFVVVLGPNGSGKTSLFRAVLGQLGLRAGTAEFRGHPVRRGQAGIGYVPQQRIADRATPLRARDLVALGYAGHRFGLPLPSRTTRERVDQTLAAVGAGHLATEPLGRLSGGEQQRIRIGQALIGDPRLLLCDEPLSSLDLRHQHGISELLDASRRGADRAVVMIAHDVNPVLDLVDRVVYLAAGQARIGTVGEVLDSAVLSELYGTRVEVLRTGGRVVVVGAPDDVQGQLDDSHHHHDEPETWSR